MRISRPLTRHPQLSGQQEQTVRLPSPEDVRQARNPTPARRDLRALEAVVYLPGGVPGGAQWTQACGEYVQRQGYRLAAVCATWRDAVHMLFTGKANIIVVGRRDHLPADETPRLEVVAEQKPDAPPTRRRPRRL